MLGRNLVKSLFYKGLTSYAFVFIKDVATPNLCKAITYIYHVPLSYTEKTWMSTLKVKHGPCRWVVVGLKHYYIKVNYYIKVKSIYLFQLRYITLVTLSGYPYSPSANSTFLVLESEPSTSFFSGK